MDFITKNYMEPGGDRWILRGTLDREGAPVLPVENLQASIVQHYRLDPNAISAVAVHAAVALAAAPQAVTTNITHPDFPRTVTVKGNAAGIVGNVVITGTNVLDEEITDTIALNGANEVEGVKAFKTVTAFDLPVEVHAGTDTVSVGQGKKFGLPHIVAYPGCLLAKLFNAAADAGTLAVDADEIEKNLYSLAGVPDGALWLDLYYLV
jgi:hypothetical protein